MRQAAKRSFLAAAAGAVVAVAAVAASAPAFAQAKEQFFPVLSYRTGAYAPNGIPFANGYVDYLKLVNARDGGINGIKITFEECETGYATDRGVVAVMDPRLGKANYRWDIVKALPPMKRTRERAVAEAFLREITTEPG